MDKYERDGSPVRCTGLQHTQKGLGSNPSAGLIGHVTLAIHLTSPHLQDGEDNVHLAFLGGKCKTT